MCRMHWVEELGREGRVLRRSHWLRLSRGDAGNEENDPKGPKPASTESKLVLPDPDGPQITMRSPPMTFRLISRKT